MVSNYGILILPLRCSGIASIKTEMYFEIGANQVQGGRNYQEDTYQVFFPDSSQEQKKQALVVMADGMGGHAGGAVASQLVVETIVSYFERKDWHALAVDEMLTLSTDKANQALLDHVRNHPELHGMGCTLVLAHFSDNSLQWLSVGDSHLYLLRDGEVIQKNDDHSYGAYVDKLEADGEIIPDMPNFTPRRNMLMSYVNGEEIAMIDLQKTPFKLLPGDRLIIASDGLDTANIEDFPYIARANDTAQSFADALIAAMEAVGKKNQDNTTVIVIDVFAEPGEALLVVEDPTDDTVVPENEEDNDDTLQPEIEELTLKELTLEELPLPVEKDANLAGVDPEDEDVDLEGGAEGEIEFNETIHGLEKTFEDLEAVMLEQSTTDEDVADLVDEGGLSVLTEEVIVDDLSADDPLEHTADESEDGPQGRKAEPRVAAPVEQPTGQSATNSGAMGKIIGLVVGGLIVLGGIGFYLMSGGESELSESTVESAEKEAPTTPGQTEPLQEVKKLAEGLPDDVEPEPLAPAAVELEKETKIALKFIQDNLTRGGKGPEMVVLPGGTFTMGSKSISVNFEERPEREVRVEAFAISRHEVTFDQYDRFVTATGAKRPGDQGWGRGARPVINVSRDDARKYADWLSSVSGNKYQLPSESQWEYAARAGTTSDYWWGAKIGKNNANCWSCGSSWDKEQTAEVGSFAANPWGIFDMSGNVLEWTADCYHKNYEGAPRDSRAWRESNCESYVIRGGSYSNPPDHLRSAKRTAVPADARQDNLGFRLVRNLK